MYTLYLCSQFIYELTNSDAIAPTEKTIRTWLEKIGEKIGIALTYTKRLRDVIVNRAQHLAYKKFTGGRQRSSFMQQSWMLKLTPDEVSCSLLLEQNDSLRQQISTLQQQNSSLEQQVDTLQSQNIALHTSIHQQQEHSMPAPSKLISDFSKSYQRKLKRKRTQSCEASLQWLKDHGLIPTQVTVRHLDSGELSLIHI